jgi:hypothetical protein
VAKPQRRSLEPVARQPDVREANGRADDDFIEGESQHVPAERAFVVTQDSLQVGDLVPDFAVSRQALARLYGACLPGTEAVVRFHSDLHSGGLEYTVDFVDRTGKSVAEMARSLVRHDDGSLELHRCGAWVDPEYRSRALSVEVMSQEIDMLKALSCGLPETARKRTRITLAAGPASDINGVEGSQALGAYTWAQLGFDYADAWNAVSTVWDYGSRLGLGRPDDGRPDRELQLSSFRNWLSSMVSAKRLPLTPSQLDDVGKVIEQIQNPWELANFDLGEPYRLDIELGGHTTRCGLGKAFLIAGNAPFWNGVYFVNDEGSPGSKVFEGYRNIARERAATSAATRTTRTLEELASPDLAVRQAAVERIGASGSASWLKKLDDLAARDPAVRDEVEIARQRLSGNRLNVDLERVAADPTVSGSRRARAAELLAVHSGRTDPEFWSQLALANEDKTLRWEALAPIVHLFAKNDPAFVVRITDQVLQMSESEIPEHEWTVKARAAWVYCQLPPEFGLGPMCELVERDPRVHVRDWFLDLIRNTRSETARGAMERLTAEGAQ